MKLKVLLKDKFWIVEQEGQKVGTLAFDDEKFVYSDPNGVQFFASEAQIKNNLGIDFKSSISLSDSSTLSLDVHGYPCSVRPYNTMFNVKSNLPLFTKSDKSKSDKSKSDPSKSDPSKSDLTKSDPSKITRSKK